MSSFFRDLGYALRTLRRAPGFAFISILVMAVGIGANAAIFTVIRSVLLRPLPFPHPERLVALYGQNDLADPKSENVVAAGDFYEWQKAAHGFEQMALWRWTGYNMTNSTGELPEFLNAGACSWNLFSTFGVNPAVGRSFTAADDGTGAAPTVMLSWNFFERRFGGNPSIVGRTIYLNSKPYTVVGVLPKLFTYPDPKIQLWVPFHVEANSDEIQSHYNHRSHVVARLKPGVSAAVATQEVSAVEYQLYQRFHGNGPVSKGVLSRPLLNDLVEDVQTQLYVLMAAIGCLLLIACLNLSNLLVARSAMRLRETAIRTALGSSRWQLIRQQLAESLVICVAGGILGAALATGATDWLTTHWTNIPRVEAVHPDGMVLAFAIAIIFLTGILSGLLPAVAATRSGILSSLQQVSRSIGGSTSRALLRKVLLTAEVALTVVMLIGAGLLFRSFLRLRSVDLGCETRNVLTMNFFLRGDKYSKPEQILSFDTQLLEQVRRLPGVTAAGLTNVVPGDGYYGDTEVKISEHPPLPLGEHRFALFRTADPGYFQAIGIPLIEGRFFRNDERLDHDRFVIVNRKFVRSFFPNEDPIGKHLHTSWRSSQGEDYEIVGVVGDTPWQVGRPVPEMMWFPILSGIPSSTADAMLVIRSDRNVVSLALPVQKVIAALDPSLPVKEVLTMDQIIGRSTEDSSFSASLVMVFAGISLLLAAVGLYGVLAYLVTQRTVEIGIRMALGAARQNILKDTLIDGMRPALIGLVLGIAGSAAVTQTIRSVLYGTSPFDTAVFVSVIGTLLLTAAVACLLPALRATRIEPMRALRTE